MLAQNGPVLLYLATAAMGQARRRHSTRAGFLIGLSAGLKVLPLSLAAVPFVLGSIRRTVAGLVLAGLVAIGVLAALTGPDRSLALWRQWLEGVGLEHTHQAYTTDEAMLRFSNQAVLPVLVRTVTDVGALRPQGAVRLAAWPPGVAWAMYLVMLGAALAAWLACAWRCRAMADDRGWLVLFALTAILMLIVSPLVWSHYFIWLLPACMVLRHWRRFLFVWAVVSAVGLATIQARGLGVHMALGLALYAVIAWETLSSAVAGQTYSAPSTRFPSGSTR